MNTKPQMNSDDIRKARRWVLQREEAVKYANNLLADARAALIIAETACSHQWGKTVWCGEHKEGYTIPGDAPGTMGVDWRGPIYVSPKTIDKWQRTCTLCGKEEFTTYQKVIEISEPSF